MNKKNKFYTHHDWLKEQIKDPEFVRALKAPDDDPFIEAAYQLIQLRKKNHVTQKELAKKLHTTQQAIARLESSSYRGHSLQMLSKIANAFGKNLHLKFV